jgi:hypothetical protein
MTNHHDIGNRPMYKKDQRTPIFFFIFLSSPVCFLASSSFGTLNSILSHTRLAFLRLHNIFHSSLLHSQSANNNNNTLFTRSSTYSHSHSHTHILTMRFSTISILAAILAISYQGMHPLSLFDTPFTPSSQQRQRAQLDSTWTALLKRNRVPPLLSVTKGSHTDRTRLDSTLISKQHLHLHTKNNDHGNSPFPPRITPPLLLLDANLQPNHLHQL